MSRLINCSMLYRRNVPLFYTAASGGRIWFYNGNSWIEDRPKGDVNGNWYSVAMSEDGSTRIAVEYNGRAYLFKNGAWAITNPDGFNGNRDWYHVSMSDDGTKMCAVRSSHSVQSCFNGTNWVQMSSAYAGTRYKTSIHRDGTKIYVTDISSTYLYIYDVSTGNSTAYTTVGGTLATPWTFFADENHTKMMTVRYNGRVRFTTNGTTWNDTGPYAAGTNRPFRFGHISSDGNTLLVGGQDDLWTLEGGIWIQQQPNGLNMGGIWYSGRLSKDGSKILAANSGGVLHYKQNSVWTPIFPNGDTTNRIYLTCDFHFIP